jgi:hypothetical protein
MKQKEYSMARAVQQLLLHCSVVAVIAPAFGTAILFLLAPPTLDGSSASEVPSLLRLPMGFLFGLVLLPFSLHWIIPFTIVAYFGCRYLQYLEPARPVWLVLVYCHFNANKRSVMKELVLPDAGRNTTVSRSASIATKFFRAALSATVSAWCPARTTRRMCRRPVSI